MTMLCVLAVVGTLPFLIELTHRASQGRAEGLLVPIPVDRRSDTPLQERSLARQTCSFS